MEVDPYILGAVELAQGLAIELSPVSKQEYIVRYCEQVQSYRQRHGQPAEIYDIEAERQFALDSLPAHLHPAISAWAALSLKIYESGEDGESTPIDPYFLGLY